MGEFKGTKVFPKYEGGDNTSIDLIFESGAVISIDRSDRYSDKLVMSREELEANAKLIVCAPEMLEMLAKARLQIEYLQEKFKETGSGNSVLSQIDSLLKKVTE